MSGIEAILEIKSNDEKYIYSIYKALEPDNINPPEKVIIKTNILKENNIFTYRFIVKTIFQARKYDSLRGTLDEVLSLIEAVDNTLTMLK